MVCTRYFSRVQLNSLLSLIPVVTDEKYKVIGAREEDRETISFTWHSNS